MFSPDTSLGASEYTKYLNEAFASLPEAIQTVTSNIFEEAQLGSGWKKALADKIGIEMHGLNEDPFTVDEVEIILNPDFVIKRRSNS